MAEMRAVEDLGPETAESASVEPATIACSMAATAS